MGAAGAGGLVPAGGKPRPQLSESGLEKRRCYNGSQNWTPLCHAGCAGRWRGPRTVIMAEVAMRSPVALGDACGRAWEGGLSLTE